MKVKIRQAKIEDIPRILFVEKEAWGQGKSASEEMFESRIRTFPEGTLLAEVNSKILGVVVTEIVDYDLQKDAYTWREVTDNGFIKNSHKPTGNTIYGVDLSVIPSFQRLGVGRKLLESIGKLAVRYNIKQGMLGGRIPGYHKYSGEMSVEEYVFATIKKENSAKPLDPEISFYRKAGLEIVKIIPDYFEDPESLNYGILLLWRNPFYNKWYRWLAVKLFKV
jgi:ribosomal protein S18 acetylase RimI-like enzyme